VRVIFAGTPEFAACALAALRTAGHDIVLVLTQPDRPAGRGLTLQASAVKTLAQQIGVTVLQPRGLRLDGRYADEARQTQQSLQAVQADVMVVAAYGLILPRWVLNTPRLGCLNIHASLLPRWRGAAPIHRAIEAGDETTGITIMQMDEGLDTGAMLLQAEQPLRPDDTTATLHDRLASLGGELIVEALLKLAAGGLSPVAQPDVGITYAHKVDKAQGKIDWAQGAVDIERRARAFDPVPGCTWEWQGQTLKLWRAAVHPGRPGELPGTPVDLGGGRWGIVCAQGVIEPLVVQRPGGRRITFSQFLQ
jgi:methionyl-tRNA formyltransferase